MQDTESKGKFIIGFGTGRCGTSSLAELLSKQNGAVVPHEFGFPLPWEFSEQHIQKRIVELCNMNGDVAFYYLNYVDYLLDRMPNIKFVCLKRDKGETIESYMRKSENRNNWLQHDGTVWKKNPRFYHAYPKFKVESKEKALGQYYDLYYKKSRKYELKYPDSFKVFQTDDLNHKNGVENILSFCGFKSSEMFVKEGICLNRSRL